MDTALRAAGPSAPHPQQLADRTMAALSCPQVVEPAAADKHAGRVLGDGGAFGGAVGGLNSRVGGHGTDSQSPGDGAEQQGTDAQACMLQPNLLPLSGQQQLRATVPLDQSHRQVRTSRSTASNIHCFEVYCSDPFCGSTSIHFETSPNAK